MELPLWFLAMDICVAILLYMTMWWLLALYAKRIDVVDMAWAFGSIYIVILTLIIDGHYRTIAVMCAAFVGVWGVRLFLHLGNRIATSPEDKRYSQLRSKWGNSFGAKSYTNVFLLQGLLLILVSAPAVAIIASAKSVNETVAVIGFIMWGFGICYEALADYQLRQFNAGKKPGDVMSKGLWRYSRHPNYFGEILLWSGAGIVACSVGQWWGIIGPVVIAFLLVKISGVPSIEKQYTGNEQYQEYKNRTSVLIPRLPKKHAAKA